MATQGPPRKGVNKAKKPQDAATPEVTEAAVSDAPQIADAVEDAVVVLDEPEKASDEAAKSEDSAPVMEAPAPEVERASVATPPAIVKAGPGFIPLVLGGVVAAGLGFALARYVVPEGWPVPGSSPLQQQLTMQSGEIADLRGQLQALPKESAANAVMDELVSLRETAAAALQTAEAAKMAVEAAQPATPVEDLGPRIAAVEDRMLSLEARPVGGAGADPLVLSRLTDDIATLRMEITAQKTAAIASAQESEAARVATETKAQSVLLQAALAKVEAALQSGVPFADPLMQLADAGIMIPAVLSDNAEAGLPTTAALAESFAGPARAALEESLRGNMGSTWPERVGSFLRSQTGARSLTPKEGDDPDAILSRANAAVFAGDLQTALAEIATLPEVAQPALSDWVGRANLRLNAQTAAADLAAALGER